MTKDKHNLVVVMAGDNSLHREYAAAPRDFELCVVYYGSRQSVLDEYRQSADAVFAEQGMKIELVRRLFVERMLLTRAVELARYKFIFMPDDDIRFPNGAASISTIFQFAEAVRADIFQPAVANEYYSPAWEPTRRIPGAFCHRVNIVETMMHGFSGEAFTRAYLPAIHAMEFMKSGWGIEPITLRIGEAIFRRPLRTFVFDSLAAEHTRPVGSGGSAIHTQGQAEARFVPQIATNRMKTLRVYTSMEEAVLDCA